MDFTDKVVLITGASSGIGAATAVLYSKYSAKLALVGRNVENLKEVAQECENSKGIKPLTIVADVRNLEDLKRIVDETVDHFGGIDVLINNAGIGSHDSIRDLQLEEVFIPIFETNLRSVYVLTHHALPHLIKSKGNIVNISSILSYNILPELRCLSYPMMKAALDQFTKTVAFDLGPDGVRVNSINPGITESNIWERSGYTPDAAEEFLLDVAKIHPLKRVATSEDIAHTIVHISSDLARNITGSIILSDGGRSLGSVA